MRKKPFAHAQRSRTTLRIFSKICHWALVALAIVPLAHAAEPASEAPNAQANIESASSGAASAELASKAETYLKACADVLEFNGSVLLRHEGQTVLRRGYGLANVEHEVANGPETKFRIGSITKSFTAFLMLRMQEAGKLKLDDKLSAHLADTPATWKEITLRHLLNHTSGIFNFTNSLDYLSKQATLGKPSGLVAWFRDKPLNFTPGEKHEYSNSGYLLLGLVLEKVSGKSFEALLKQEILGPLAMNDSGCDRAASVIPHRASGYSSTGKRLQNAGYIDMQGVFAAGIMYSTVDDLARYDEALDAGKLLSPESYAELYRPALDNYALGWVVEPESERKLIWHNGGINGFSTSMWRCPETQSCAIVLSNVESGNCDRMARELLALLHGEEYRLPRQHTEVKVDPAALDALVGQYQVAPGVVMNVTRENDKLKAQLTGQPKTQVFPESPTEFFYKIVDAQLEFVLGTDGKASHLVLYQGGQKLRAERIVQR